ncbi:Swi1 protein [Martiniozyma asiatica (nom. inval.)]|nr:Swi1 protein [Martiniozyma asiatica]
MANRHNVDRFLALVTQYMQRIGKPFNPRPIVGGVTINLFAVYYLVQYMGGIKKALEENKLILIAQRVGITNSQNLKEFVKMYDDFLYPFEQYAKSPNGAQELAMMRDKVHPANLQQQQQKQQQQQQQQQQQHHQQQLQQQPPTQQIQSQPTPLGPQSPVVTSQVQMGLNSNTPIISSQPVQIDISNNMVFSLDDPKVANIIPEKIKSYQPLSFFQDGVSGIDIQTLQSLGERVADMQPVFLFFPEIGKIDLKALSLALQSGIDAEINVALNILLIVTTEPTSIITLEHVPILLKSLCKLGTELVNRLIDDDLERNIKRTQIGEHDLNNLNNRNKNKIDEVFDKYTSELISSDYPIKNDVIYVDSFTSQIVSVDGKLIENSSCTTHSQSIKSNLYDKSENLNIKINSYDFKHLINKITPETIDSFDYVHYIDLVHKCRQQADCLSIDIDNKNSTDNSSKYDIHSKSYTSRRIMFMEELSTVSLIIRNLSFITENHSIMAYSSDFLDYIYSIIFASIQKENNFINKFERKRLALLKDTLIILTNTSQFIDVRSEIEMWLIWCLVVIFGPNLSNQIDGFITTKVDNFVDRYHVHAIDVFSKIICGSSHNSGLLKNLVKGDINDPLVKRWILAAYKGENVFTEGKLWLDVISLLLSTIPIERLHQSTVHFNEKSYSILESLLSALVVADILKDIISDSKLDNSKPMSLEKNIACLVFTSKENLGMVLGHLCFLYVCIYVNTAEKSQVVDHLHISARAIELINKLANCALDMGGNELNEIPKVLGSMDHLINLLMTIQIPLLISFQVVEAIKLQGRLEKLVN